MEFFKSDVKHDTLNVLVYKEILKLLKAYTKEHMRLVPATNVFQTMLDREIYVLLTKSFKKSFKDQLEAFRAPLITFIKGNEGKYMKKTPEDAVRDFLEGRFSNEEKVNVAHDEYLTFLSKRLLDPPGLGESADIFVKCFFTYEDFLTSNEAGKREIGDTPLLSNGYKVSGSNWTTVRECFDGAEDQPWVIAAVLVFTVMILLTTFLILFFFFA